MSDLSAHIDDTIIDQWTMEKHEQLTAELALHIAFDEDMCACDKCPSCDALVHKTGNYGSCSLRHNIDGCPGGRVAAHHLRVRIHASALLLSQTDYPFMEEIQ